MKSIQPELRAIRPVGAARLSPLAVLMLAISCGLAGGYLDVAIIVLKKFVWNGEKNFGTAYDFPWTVPVGHLVVLAVPCVLVALVCAVRPKPVSLGSAAWLFATLASWNALLRLPLHGLASLILAAGVGRHVSAAIEGLCKRPGAVRLTVAGLLAVLLFLAGASSRGRAIHDYRAFATLPAPPPHARNVILIVWDTVRAANLSVYDYPRDTTPNLARWARRGVRYKRAVSPAPWTYPSHASFFTGHWPFQLRSQWKYTLDAPVPTLAEQLASLGYETAGFSANTLFCSYETRLDRGFTHFVDYPLTARSLFTRTVAGSGLLEHIILAGQFYESKWIRFQSRNAAAINRELLDWLARRRSDRPFLAYLNYFDAHEPYVPPPGYEGRFGIKPRSVRDYRFLLDYGAPGLKRISARDVEMARDCYDDCIAYLDDQLGRLLDHLRDSGILDDTLVIITSDHGESFGDHGLYLHPGSLYLDELAVPLVILAPGTPANRLVTEPVSLRDLPATVFDVLGLRERSPFPGHSLADCWRAVPGTSLPEVSPVLSEYTTEAAFGPQPKGTLQRRNVQMSLVDAHRHYIRDGFGKEQLYDLTHDERETDNLIDSAPGAPQAGMFRKALFDALDVSPGSIEAEKAYLDAFRQWLKSLASESTTPPAPLARLETHAYKSRE
jgi:arylsulfatase A-like enzyme